ncbi:hypothetical protein L3X38_026840 [Prunus dulcis]|uniref:Integrase catalytic domain-containing protein n=1 Tax=Prunus dulcis TaxID=3755 RepID=A0AAD4YZV0_PRUDU|nr:hypothetical protein L3X38_026840 [Prunus dulcis]
MFKIFQTKVERQLEKIKIVRSDIGGEYYGRFDEEGRRVGSFARYIQDNGIDAQYTTPGTPQQNRVAERRNRTLKDMVCSMISKTDLPKSLWREAIKTANYILNRVPSYPPRSKGFRFYCLNYGTRIFETDCAKFIEYEENATGNEDFIFEKEGDVDVIENAKPESTILIPMSDIALAPPSDQLEPPQFEEPIDQQEEQTAENPH